MPQIELRHIKHGRLYAALHRFESQVGNHRCGQGQHQQQRGQLGPAQQQAARVDQHRPVESQQPRAVSQNMQRHGRHDGTAQHQVTPRLVCSTCRASSTPQHAASASMMPK
jgi:hypothetical protein